MTAETTFLIEAIGTVQRTNGEVTVDIDPRYWPALQGLDTFSHVIVYWWADRFDMPDCREMLVVPLPYAADREAGVFACRAPVRPNLIMSTVCEIKAVDVDSGTVRVGNIDAVAGTPVLDLKAYFPVMDRVEKAHISPYLTGWPEWVPPEGIGLMEGEELSGQALLVRTAAGAVRTFPGATPMQQVVIERSPRLLLAGFSFFGDPFHSHAGWTEKNEIGRLWQRLLAYYQASAHAAPPRITYEVHIQNSETPRTGEFEVFVGSVVDTPDEVPLELCLKQLPQTAYAVFTLKGSQMQQDEPLVDNWLRANGYRVALPFFIERYDERYLGLDRLDESVLEFLVPIEPVSGADGPD